MENTYTRIITAATMAPSGDNSQPWSFVVSGNVISLYMHPEKDHEMLNVKQGGTLLASGAALENLRIAARSEGFYTDIALFPDSSAPTLVARITLTPGYAPTDADRALAALIPLRHTNRRAYRTDALPKTFFEDCAAIATEYAPCRLTFVKERKELARAGSAASAMEEAALQTKSLHQFFFGSILWDYKPHLAGEAGMHIKTLELPPPARPIFKAFRSWPLVNALNTVGFAQIAAQGNAKVYASVGAMAGFIVPDRAPATMVRAGQCVQRIWLESVRHGLAAHPLAGLLYIAAYIEDGHAAVFPPRVVERVKDASRALYSLFCAQPHEAIAMTLRLGTPSRPPTDYSRRKTPVMTEV